MSFNPWGFITGKAENTLARVPVVGSLLGAKTDSEKALEGKQKQMAAEARKQQELNQQSRMNALGQQMLAFNPQNQMMAQMFGPQAAFQPEQLAQMAQNPMKPAYDEKWSNYKGTDPKTQADIEDYIKRKAEYDRQEAARRDMLMGGIQQPGAGPAPIQMSAPQAARKF